MKCPKCNREITENVSFCPECGTKLNERGEIRRKHSRNQKRKRRMSLAIGCLLGIGLIFGIVRAMVKPEINLNEYITVSFEGYDTVGRATVEFDTEKFRENYKGKLRSSFVSDYLDWELDQNQKLSNGDIVLLSWDCEDETVLSRYGYKLKYEDVSYTVEGLQEILTFDPFEGVDVAFEGISMHGKAEIVGNPTENAAQDLKYELDKKNDLKNGDTVTLTVTMYGDDPSEYCIENYGMKPTSSAKTYPVNGLSQYVQSLSEISEDGLTDMQTQAQAVFDAYVEKDWGETEEVTDFTYIGSYLLSAKDEEAYSPYNECYLVYKVNMHHMHEDYNYIAEMYWFVAFENLVVNSNGELSVDLTNWGRPNHRVEFYPNENDSWHWWYYGYATLEELYADVVTSNLRDFNHDDGILIN